jgi:hypothetical protein
MNNIFVNPENFYVVISSILISLSGFLVFTKFPKEAFLLIVSGIFSLLFHLNPENQILRIFDWVFVFILLFVLFPKVYFAQNLTLNIFVSLLFFVWLISFLSFNFGKIQIYNFTHTLWHIGVAIFVLFLLK